MNKINVEEIIKGKVTKFGNSAHVTLSKKHIGSEVFVLVKSKKKKVAHPLVFQVEQGRDPRVHEVDWKEFERIEKEWEEFPDDGYYKPKRKTNRSR